mgnify:CR=1 FL=1
MREAAGLLATAGVPIEELTDRYLRAFLADADALRMTRPDVLPRATDHIPEIVDLICILQKMGAIITVHTDRVIEILGVPKLHGYNHKPIPDRIEAASWAAAALATRGEIEVLGAQQADMMTFLTVFRSIGGEFEITDARVGRPGVTGVEGGIKFWHPGGELKAVALETDVHPGFMTDWQQPLVVALTQLLPPGTLGRDDKESAS